MNKGGTNSGAILGNKAYVKQLNSILTRQFRFGFLIEQDADPVNSVSLSKTHTDNLGIPRPEINYTLSSYTARGFSSAISATKEFMTRLGAKNFTSAPDPSRGAYVNFKDLGVEFNFQGSGHLCGTHVMGTTPSNSVVNRMQQSWDHENLYIIGCGSMPSIGTQNPTLSMTAMTLISAEAILGRLG